MSRNWAKFLALGRGLKAGVVRNGTNLYHMLRYPIDTAESLGQLVKNIGIGIGKVALTLSKHELGLELGNEHLMHAAQQDVDNWLCGGRQLYELAKQTWQNKSKLERYELVGNYAVDLLLLKGLPQAGKLAGIKNLAAYKPQAFTKLGEIGREINQIAGLTCAKGVKTIEQNLEIIRIYPQIVQSKQLSSEAVLYSNKCLKASKHYLRKLGKYATKCAINKEQRLVKSGDQVKKMPKACIAKTKQLIGGEIVVTDALGNIWHSKIGESSWSTDFSEQGKCAVTLLNEVAGGLKGVAQEAFQHYRAVAYTTEARETLNIMKWQFEAVERELQALGVRFKDFYGSHVESNLGNELIHFKGKSHLLSATIKRNIKASGVTEKVTGLHWDYMRKLEQVGVYSLSDVEYLAGEMYRATINYGGVVKKGKTFFPSHWDAKMLTFKISEACRNATKVVMKRDGVLEITGMVEEGFQIIVKIGKRGNIITAYPEVAGKIL